MIGPLKCIVIEPGKMPRVESLRSPSRVVHVPPGTRPFWLPIRKDARIYMSLIDPEQTVAAELVRPNPVATMICRGAGIIQADETIAGPVVISGQRKKQACDVPEDVAPHARRLSLGIFMRPEDN